MFSNIFLQRALIYIISIHIFCPGEAKNLQSRSHGSPGIRDVYCALSLDQEEIFRTTTMERTLK